MTRRHRLTTRELLQLVTTAQQRRLTPDEGLALGKGIRMMGATIHDLSRCGTAERKASS